MATMDRERKHDERWQAEVLDGMARMLDVLHDISDGLRDLSTAVGRLDATTKAAPTEATPDPPKVLLSVNDLAEILGVSGGTIRSLRFSGKAPTATMVGSRLMFHRLDVDQWLAKQREGDVPDTRPWRGSYLGGRIGSSVPRSTEPTPYCNGSGEEPLAASRFSGRAICRACRDDVLANKNGRLRKHRPYYH